MLDPVVHAALVVVAAWLIQLAFAALGLDLGNETATGLAQVIVAYIISLFGYSLYKRIMPSNKLFNYGEYKPPFS